jgi:hypothetical protein
MQMISWQRADPEAVDNPDHVDPVLARLVRHVNDTMCWSRDGKMLCPECSMVVLHLANRTVGTRMTGWSPREAALVHARLAVEQAEEVQYLVGIKSVGEAISTARTLLTDPDSTSLRQDAMALTEQVDLAAQQAATSSGTAATVAANFALNSAACVTRLTHGRHVQDRAGIAVTRAFEAADAQVWCGRPDEAHRVIDRFTELAGLPEAKTSLNELMPA